MRKQRVTERGKVCWNGIYPKSRMITEGAEFKALSFGAQVLFDVLSRLRYGLRNPDMDNSFWRSDLMLMRDAGMIRNSLKKFRRELVEGGFLIWQSHLHEKHREPRYYLLDDVHFDDTPDRDALRRTEGFGCDETQLL